MPIVGRKRPNTDSQGYIRTQKGFYTTQLEFSYGRILSAEHGLGHTIKHIEPNADGTGGTNGNVLVLSGDFEALKKTLKDAQDKAENTAQNFVDKICDPKSNDEVIKAAKKAFEEAHTAAMKQLEAYGSSKDMGGHLVKVSDPSPDNRHGIMMPTWKEFHLKYVDNGVEKTVKVAVRPMYRDDVQFSSYEMLNTIHGADEGRRVGLDGQKKDLLHAAKDFLPTEKKAENAQGM